MVIFRERFEYRVRKWIKGVSTFNQFAHDQPSSFHELAAELAKYDVVDMLQAVGGLQLLPENASRLTRLEAFSHCAASLAPSAAPRVSIGMLRRFCAHRSLESIAYTEDPAEEQFAEEITFFGGSYLVLPGIAEAAEFMLSNLCAAIFLDPRSALPGEFRTRVFEIVSSALHVSNAMAQKAGIQRGTQPASNLGNPIVVPEARVLSKLKNAVTFTADETRALLQAANLPPDALNPLVSKIGEFALKDYDIVNGPLLWKPLVDCNGTMIVAIPGMIVSAIRQRLLQLAYESKLDRELADAYNRAVWRNVKQSLDFTGNVAFPGGPSGRSNVLSSSDGFFGLDQDKLLYCLLITDPLTRPAAADPFGQWMDDALSLSIDRRISQVETDVFGRSPAPNDLFIVVVFGGLGGTAAFGLNRTRANSHLMALSAEALRTICLLEGGDPLALFNFARARDRAESRYEIITTNVLDEFYVYRQRRYSFYFSDEAPPDLIWIPPGDSLNLQMEIARERDFHGAETASGSTVEVTSLHSTSAIPVYSPVNDLGQRVRLVVEGLPVLIWVIGPERASPDDHSIYALFADAISFWLWQFTPFLKQLLATLESFEPIEITIELPNHDFWHRPMVHTLDLSGTGIATEINASCRLIRVRLTDEAVPLFQRSDNTGERELMRHILSALSRLLRESEWQEPTAASIGLALDKIAPVGLKKMILLFDARRTPEIDNRGLPRYRPLQQVWINDHLDQLGEFLTKDLGLEIGPIDPEQRNDILNKIAYHCFAQLQRIIATLSPDALLEFVVGHSESAHREQVFNRLTIPTRMECFQSDPNMIEQLRTRVPELANVGLASRFLIELITAQPPRGLRPISLDLYDQMRAWSYHCLNYAMLSDAVHFGIQEYTLSMLPSNRLGVDGTAHQSAINGHMRAFALDQIGAASESFRRLWEPVKLAAEGEDLRTQLDSATAEEFGVPLSELLQLMEVGISIGQQEPRAAATLPELEFVERAAKAMKRDESTVRAALDLLTLGPRQSFWTPPPGYVKADLYPWRYNRPLSHMRRPFLRHIAGNDVEIIWGFRHVRVAQRFLVDQCTSGRLNARAKRMRSFMNGLVNARGEKFNANVSAFFSSFGELKVKSRVKKVGKLRELQDHLGDIDVLVGDIKRSRILVIECKDLSLARTPYEMANEFSELFIGAQNRKSIIEKHRARSTWVKANVRAVAEFLELRRERRWKIIPLIIVDQPLWASYVRTSPIKVLSFEELRRFWPVLRRV